MSNIFERGIDREPVRVIPYGNGGVKTVTTHETGRGYANAEMQGEEAFVPSGASATVELDTSDFPHKVVEVKIDDYRRSKEAVIQTNGDSTIIKEGSKPVIIYSMGRVIGRAEYERPLPPPPLS